MGQLADWQSRGLLSAEQAGPILELYETANEQSERQRSTALLVLMGIAAFLVGLGVMLLVGYNWNALPDVMKLVMIFGAIFGTHAGGFNLRFRRGSMVLSEIVFFLGCLFYGAGIFLVAQIFNLNAHYPDGIWWWSLGVLPFALCMDTLVLHILLASLLAIWCGMEILGFRDIGLWFFGRWNFGINGAYSLLLFALLGLQWAYRRGSVAAVGIYVPLLAWWMVLQPVAWQLEAEAVYFIGALGGLLIIVAENHSVSSRFAIPYRLFGVLLASGALTALSFYDFSDAILRFQDEGGGLVHTLMIVILLAVTIFVCALFNCGASPTRMSILQQMQKILLTQYLAVGLVALMAILTLWRLIIIEPLFPVITANMAMIVLAFWLMALGLRQDRGQPFAAGVALFLFWAVLRYCDLFGDFGGMLGAALMFFLCGGTLFGVAVYWRNRRRKQYV
ncbi:MAG: DUF2157 domain-containing protein [Planctomycetia bacterium]